MLGVSRMRSPSLPDRATGMAESAKKSDDTALASLLLNMDETLSKE